MAEKLKSDYDIIVLKTELVDEGREYDIVHFTLQHHTNDPGRPLVEALNWKAPLSSIVSNEALRHPQGSADERAFWLPLAMLVELSGWFQTNTPGNVPLWIHLVKPYGLLRYVPWERLIGKSINVPVLMLPDFIFPPPREALASLDVILCGNAPLHTESHSILQGLTRAIERIVQTGGRHVRLHIFVDGTLNDPIKSFAQSLLLGEDKIHIYDAASVAPYVAEDLSSRLVDRSGAIRSPWLLWMRDVMGKQSVDVVHFVCHGFYNGRRGALLFAQSPGERTERYLAGPVSATELDTFLTQVGAWSSVFTSMPDNASEAGLRGLADEIAQMRPGPMMMHVMKEDPDANQLAEGYRFLYSESNGAPPSSTTALFLYCQPSLAAEEVSVSRRRAAGVSLGQWARTASVASAAGQFGALRNIAQEKAVLQTFESVSPLDGFFENDVSVPAVVASTERFAEKVQLHYQQLARDEILPVAMREQEMEAVLGTVDKLRKAVADLEHKGGHPSEATS